MTSAITIHLAHDDCPGGKTAWEQWLWRDGIDPERVDLPCALTIDPETKTITVDNYLLLNDQGNNYTLDGTTQIASEALTVHTSEAPDGWPQKPIREVEPKYLGREITIVVWGNVDRDHPVEDDIADAAWALGEKHGLDINLSSCAFYADVDPKQGASGA